MTDIKWDRVIFHVDMDAFFAAVEQLLEPSLRGKPVIIGADPQKGQGRGVVSTASYEARRFGVHSAMPISRAYKLCPHGIFITPKGNHYRRFSKQVYEILQGYSPLVQKVSIDEAFLDVSGHPFFKRKLPGTDQVSQLAAIIRSDIFQQTGLTASLGAAPSKSVAKIASDFNKPDGQTIVAPDKVQVFLDPLSVTRLWGVGQKTYKNLSAMGIGTVAQLRAYPPDLLGSKFGKMGDHLYRMARGVDVREVVTHEDVKSISHETTFDVDERDRERLTSTLLLLSEKVSARLRQQGCRGKTIQLKLRFADFTTFTRANTLSQPTCLTEDIFAVSKALFERFDDPRAVRLIGVGVSHLMPDTDEQLSLWSHDKNRKARLEEVIDNIQQKHGKNMITHAQTLALKQKKSPKSD